MINFKDFKKIKEDKETATMAHPTKGHSIVLVLKKLPMIQREALKRLPLHEGGELKGIHKSAYDSKDKELMGESEAGKQIRQSDLKPSAKEAAKDEHNKVLSEMKSMPNPKIKGFAEGGEASSDDSDQSSDQNQPPVTVNVNQPPGQPAQPTVVGPTNPAPVPNIQTQAPSSLPTAYNQAASVLNKTQDMNTNNRAFIDKAHAAYDAYLANPNSQIDAQQFTKNMTLPSKVSTAIGLALGGFSVPFGGQNFTMQYLNDQINRNIDAQKANFEHQKNVWGAAQDLFNDDQISTNFARVVALDQIANSVKQAAFSNGSPTAAVNATKMIGDIRNQQNSLKNQSAQILTQKQLSQNQNPTPNEVPVGGITGFLNKILPTGGPMPESAISAPTNVMPKTATPAGASVPSSESKQSEELAPDEYADSPILNPNAEKAFISAKYNPLFEGNYNELTNQYTAAKKADSVLGQLHPIMQQLFSDAKSGGTLGYLRRHDPSAAIPFIGQAASEALVGPATDTPVNRRYDAAKSRIAVDIAQALHGTNVTGEQINKLIHDNTPEHGDTPSLVAQKERNIRLFIKNALPKSLLELGNIAPKSP